MPHVRLASHPALLRPAHFMATLSSFYGPKLARPYVLLDNEGNAIKDARVDPPRVQDALLGEARRSSAKAAVG